jgi:hypothetical protein
VKDIVRTAASQARALDAVAQRCAEGLFASLGNSVLIRVYATCRFGGLPALDQERVGAFAERAGVTGAMTANSPVLSLMGTAGILPEWRDRRASKDLVGIPLVGPSLGESIPMIASLMSQLSPDSQWAGPEAATDIIIKSMGRMGAVCHVPDAATSRDRRERLIVPAQDLVRAHQIKSVIGIGGAYMDGTVCAFMLYTRESVRREQAERLMPMINYFKMATMFLVNAGKRFSQDGAAAPLRQVASR